MRLNSLFFTLSSVCVIAATAPAQSHALTQKPFVIVVPSYNNKDWYEKNMHSLCCQQYDNYRIIYIDDCSDDGTAELVQEYIRTHNPACPITIIKNSARRGPAANRYYATHLCNDDEIMVMVDGDDWLAHPHVLSYLNELYQDQNVWLTYGHYKRYPSDEQGWTRKMPEWVIEHHLYRNYGWITSHLRTCYAWLAKQIKLKDMLFEGVFFPMSTDIAGMLPMLEMAGAHARYVDQILYIYNASTPLNLFTVNPERQRSLDRMIRQYPCYEPCPKPILNRLTPHKKARACMLVLSLGNFDALEQCIQSAQRQCHALDMIHVLYHSNNKKVQRQYEMLEHQHAKVKSVNIYNNVKKELLQCIKNIKHTHIVCAVDTSIAPMPIDLSRCIYELEKTFAYCFHLTTSITAQAPLPLCNYIDDGIYAWQIAYGEKEWYHANTMNMGLYRKADLLAQWEMIPFNSLHTLKTVWESLQLPENIALFIQKTA
jgi:hypothetical protein